MKKIINWVKKSFEEFGIIYCLVVLPMYFIGVVVVPVVLSLCVGVFLFNILKHLI